MSYYALAPDRCVTRDEIDAGEAWHFADSLATKAQDINDAALALMSDDWRIPYSMGAASVRAVEQRMEALLADLKRMRDGYAPVVAPPAGDR
jgi:hypothetical protein